MITLKQLEQDHSGGTSYVHGEGSMFVNYNRFLKPFIRACKTNESKTFNFSKSGLRHAIKYLEGGHNAKTQ